MLLSDIVKTSLRVADTRSRLEKIDILSSCLKQMRDEDIEIGVSFLIGRIRQGRIGVGFAMLREVYPRQYCERPSLTLMEVDRSFSEIADVKGTGSVGEKISILKKLFTHATREEQDFLVRLILGELRQGALEGIMIEALAVASGVSSTHIRKAVMLAGDIVPVACAVLKEGISGLGRFSLRLFVPVKPMLAETAEDVVDALEQMGRAAFEYKVDGVRIQIHKMGKDVRIFTRRMNDITHQVPEIVEIAQGLQANSVILDGEALAIGKDGFPLPFQVTMRRFGRRLDVAEMQKELPLTPFFFDCLHLNGEDLIDKSAGERFSTLKVILSEELCIPRLITEDPEEADRFLDSALSKGHEGLMAKAIDSAYEAGNRGRNWLKIKPAHILDMVVLAAEWGHGRRKGFLSNLHLGVRDPSSGKFIMIGKTFKGMTDEMLAWQTQKFLEIETDRDAHTVYVRPELVVEVAFNEIQVSPHYPGGVALRFARVKRYRPDKRAEEVDTIDTVRSLVKKR